MEEDNTLTSVFVYDHENNLKYSFSNILYSRFSITPDGSLYMMDPDGNVMLYKLGFGEKVLVGEDLVDIDETRVNDKVH